MKLRDVDPKFMSSRGLTIKWTDNYFNDQYVKLFNAFPRPDRQRAVSACLAFLNLYVTSNLSEQNYTQMCLTVWAYMKVDDVHLGWNGFHTEDKTTAPTFIASSYLDKFVPTFLLHRGQATVDKDSITVSYTKSSGENISFHQADVVTWYKTLWDILNSSAVMESTSSKSDTANIDTTIYYIGYLMMKLLRLITKDLKSVEHNIVVSTITQFHQFWGRKLAVTYTPPPHADLQTNLGVFMQRFSSSCLPMLTYIVQSYITILPAHETKISGIYDASCLQALGMVGMGCVSWVLQASKMLNCSIGTLLEFFDFGPYSESLFKLERWMYQVFIYEKTRTMFYARLFHDGAYPEVSARNQPVVTMACAAIVHSTDSDHEIWQIAQFRAIKENDMDFSAALKLGCAIKKSFQDSWMAYPNTDAARTIKKLMTQESQKLHPVYFFRKKTSDTERKYSSYELEALAVIEALTKFRVYLLTVDRDDPKKRKSFKIVTDCAALEQTLHKKDITPKVARWSLFLEEYNYTTEHRPGTRLKHVDALSRYPVMTLQPTTDIMPKFKKAQENDKTIANIKEQLQQGSYQDYYIRNGLLFKYTNGYETLVVSTKMQNEIIKSVHERGHFASKRTIKEIKQEFFIPQLQDKVEKCIANCIKCILVNKKIGKQEGYLHPLHKGDVPLHTYHVDHLGPLETTHKKYCHILAVIDSFTKFTWLYPTKTVSTKEVIEKLEIQKSTFGNPTKIISDRGTASFTSTDFENYCQQENIEHARITAGLPRANGQIERINRTIIPVLAKISIDDPTKWYKHVK